MFLRHTRSLRLVQGPSGRLPAASALSLPLHHRMTRFSSHPSFSTAAKGRPKKENSKKSKKSSLDKQERSAGEDVEPHTMPPNTYLAEAWKQEMEESKQDWEEEKRKFGSDDRWHPSAWVRARSLRTPKQVSKLRRFLVSLFGGSTLAFITYQLWFKHSHDEHVKILQEEDPVKLNRLREERVRAAIRLRSQDPEFDPTMSEEYQRKLEEDRRRLEKIKRDAIRAKKARTEAQRAAEKKLEKALAEEAAEEEQIATA